MVRPAKSLAALAAVAVVSTSLGTGVASAVPQTGTKAPATHVKRMVNAAKPEAGSAGIPGFDDAKCQKLLNDTLNAYAEARNATERGDARKAWEAQGRGERTQAYLEDHCLVVY